MGSRVGSLAARRRLDGAERVHGRNWRQVFGVDTLMPRAVEWTDSKSIGGGVSLADPIMNAGQDLVGGRLGFSATFANESRIPTGRPVFMRLVEFDLPDKAVSISDHPAQVDRRRDPQVHRPIRSHPLPCAVCQEVLLKFINRGFDGPRTTPPVKNSFHRHHTGREIPSATRHT